ncbi:hypothetical protein ACFL09_06060 [Planctomycetota bacterium]
MQEWMPVHEILMAVHQGVFLLLYIACGIAIAIKFRASFTAAATGAAAFGAMALTGIVMAVLPRLVSGETFFKLISVVQLGYEVSLALLLVAIILAPTRKPWHGESAAPTQ